MASFIFGEGTPWTYDQLQEKRKLAQALMAGSGRAPKNVGEGLTAIGMALRGRILDNRAAQREQQLRDEYNSQWESLFGGGDLASMFGFGGYSGAPGGGGYGAGTYTPPENGGDPLNPKNIAMDTISALTDAPNNPEGIAADTMAALGIEPSYITYASDFSGKTRNQPLAPELVDALSYLPQLGVTAQVFSGGQPAKGSPEDVEGARTGSVRHDLGMAGDMEFYKDGRLLDWNNPNDIPLLTEIVRKGKEAGLTGWGAGDDYMGPGRMHVGYGEPVVWGAGGRSANAPQWLRDAYYGAGGTVSAPDNQYMAAARRIASAEGVPEELFLALVNQESGWNPGAVSEAGAIGLAQLMPGTASDLGVDPNNWEQNLQGGARYLRQQLDRFGSPELALAAYNAGPQRVADAGGIPNISETQNYVNAITSALGAPSGAPQATPAQYAPQGAPQGGPQVNMQTIMALGQLANNPMASPGQKAVAQALMGQALQSMQPHKPDWKFVEGIGFVDASRPDPSLMAGQYQAPREAPRVQDINGVDHIEVNGQWVPAPRQEEPSQPTTAKQKYDELIGLGVSPENALAQSYGFTPEQAAMVEGAGVPPGPDSGKMAEAAAKVIIGEADGLREAGRNASRNIARINEMEKLLQDAPQGLKGQMVSIASSMGIKLDGASEVEALTAVINQMVPEQRAPGSGTMSDADLALFKSSLPALINTREGNALIVQTMRGIAEYDIAMSNIAGQLLLGKITAEEAFKQYAQVANPLDGFGAQMARFGEPAARDSSPADGAEASAPPGVQSAGPTEEQISEFLSGLSGDDLVAFSEKSRAEQLAIIRAQFGGAQ